MPAKIKIPSLTSRHVHTLPAAPAPAAARVEFLTPVDAERGSIREQPEILFARLTRRVALLARWYDVALDLVQVDALRVQSTHCRYSFPDDLASNVRSGRAWRPPLKGGHQLQNRVIDVLAVEISGDLEMIWPFLVIGEVTHVGRGRYRLGTA